MIEPSHIDPAEAKLFEPEQIEEFQRLAAQTHPDLIEHARARLQSFHDHFVHLESEQHSTDHSSNRVIRRVGIATGLFIAGVSEYILHTRIGTVAGVGIAVLMVGISAEVLDSPNNEDPRKDVISRYLLQLEQNNTQANS